MNSRFALAAVLSFAVTGPAFAQEAEYQPTSSAGAHVAVVTGYDSTKFSGGGASDSINGITYGVKLGYDFSVMEHGLLGVEAEVTDSSAKFDAGGGDTLKMGRDIYFGGRVKFDVSETVALYVKGGYTNAELKATSGGLTAKTNVDGWRIGAGAEFQLTNNLFGLVEYRYSNYGKYSDGAGTTVKVDRHQGIAGLGYRF
jgi:outer membrane immunogenic protein